MRAGCIKFAMILCHMLLCLGGAIPVLSHAVTPVEQAFIDGQAAAQSATSSASTNITNGTIATTVNSFDPSYYNYSGTAPEAGYFMGGSGDTITPGAGKVTACQTGPVNPNAFLQQNCEAINYMVQNPTTRPQFTINPDDPMILNSKQITANAGTLAAQSLGFADPSAVGSFTACQTTTTSTSPTYTAEVCNEYLSSTTSMCIVGRDVVVDAQSNFQCNETANAYETSTCNKTLNVTMNSLPSCSVSGSYTARLGIYDISFSCDPSNTFAVMTLSITPSAQCHAGGCNSDYFPMTLSIFPGVSATSTAKLARVYYGVWWNSATVQYTANTDYVVIVTQPDDGSGYCGDAPCPTASCPSGTIQTRVKVGSKIKVVCASNPTCPAGASSFLARAGFTDADGNFIPAVYACAPNPTCPAGTSSFLFKSQIVDDNGNVVVPAQYACGPGVDLNVPFSGSMGVQWVATETWNDNCTILQAKTQ